MIGICDGKLMLLECKDSGEKVEEDQVFKLADVANRPNWSRLIFVTPTAFTDAESLCENVQSRCQARVETWERTISRPQTLGPCR